MLCLSSCLTCSRRAHCSAVLLLSVGVQVCRCVVEKVAVGTLVLQNDVDGAPWLLLLSEMTPVHTPHLLIPVEVATQTPLFKVTTQKTACQTNPTLTPSFRASLAVQVRLIFS